MAQTTSPTKSPMRVEQTSEDLVHHGRHFGRTIRAFVNFHTLIGEGVLREEQLAARVSRLNTNDLYGLRHGENTIYFASSSRWASSARSDDVKSLKSAVIDWITPPGGVLTPNIPRHSKDGRGFYHEVTGKYLCPTDYDWSDPRVKAQLKEAKLVVTVRATRSGNAELHGMDTVTVPSIAYIATLVSFSLSSVTTFCRTDAEEQVQVGELLDWWNR
ncbi:hypothetical protein FA13DRAFT_1760001 [Coprinellus micaceus]|uniref:Uncharacterized protein n=1 Tax=Coprinellus micaceus TaxID=71717 RepID=A0A4Y7RL11_COPMI|nr:hypothetical protein FA13DRAFT_1760001 [Coprinellus micaceus]